MPAILTMQIRACFAALFANYRAVFTKTGLVLDETRVITHKIENFGFETKRAAQARRPDFFCKKRP
jgi:hypothetical protein